MGCNFEFFTAPHGTEFCLHSSPSPPVLPFPPSVPSCCIRFSLPCVGTSLREGHQRKKKPVTLQSHLQRWGLSSPLPLCSFIPPFPSFSLQVEEETLRSGGDT